jgi:hypothetical protein
MNYSTKQFTKAVLNYNSVTLCGINAPVHRFSGSSMFTFVNDELLIKKEMTDNRKYEKPFENNSLNQLSLSLDFQDNVNIPKTYKLNKKIISRKLIAFNYSQLANEKLNFYTISFPAQTSDDVAFRTLNTVLTRLRKGYQISDAATSLLLNFAPAQSDKWYKYVNSLTTSKIFQQLKNYIWISERQENGTIHFHIVTSETINVLIFNYFTAVSLFNNLEKYQQDLNISHLSREKYNGVDIAKTKKSKSNVTNVRKYLTKYITKNNSVFNRFCWHCSRAVSALFTTKEFEISEINNPSFPIDVNQPADFSSVSEYFTILIYNNLDYKTIFHDLISINNDIINSFFT